MCASGACEANSNTNATSAATTGDDAAADDAAGDDAAKGDAATADDDDDDASAGGDDPSTHYCAETSDCDSGYVCTAGACAAGSGANATLSASSVTTTESDGDDDGDVDGSTPPVLPLNTTALDNDDDDFAKVAIGHLTWRVRSGLYDHDGNDILRDDFRQGSNRQVMLRVRIGFTTAVAIDRATTSTDVAIEP